MSAHEPEGVRPACEHAKVERRRLAATTKVHHAHACRRLHELSRLGGLPPSGLPVPSWYKPSSALLLRDRRLRTLTTDVEELALRPDPPVRQPPGGPLNPAMLKLRPPCSTEGALGGT